MIFSGTPAKVVTLSEAYTNFDYLVIVYSWMSGYFTATLDTSRNSQRIPLNFSGVYESAYVSINGSGNITLSGTTVTGSDSGANYSTRVTNANVVTFRDNLGDVVIVKVTGVKLS